MQIVLLCMQTYIYISPTSVDCIIATFSVLTAPQFYVDWFNHLNFFERSIHCFYFGNKYIKHYKWYYNNVLYYCIEQLNCALCLKGGDQCCNHVMLVVGVLL